MSIYCVVSCVCVVVVDRLMLFVCRVVWECVYYWFKFVWCVCMRIWVLCLFYVAWFCHVVGFNYDVIWEIVCDICVSCFVLGWICLLACLCINHYTCFDRPCLTYGIVLLCPMCLRLGWVVFFLMKGKNGSPLSLFVLFI